MALPPCERIYLTEVHAKLSADTWFPDYDAANGASAPAPITRPTRPTVIPIAS